MIKRKAIKKDKTVKVTFVLDSSDDRLPATVLGDFNEWDAAAHPLRKRNNGTHSVTVTLKAGKKFCFRYRSAEGGWFNDDDADGFETSEVGSRNCVIET